MTKEGQLSGRTDRPTDRLGRNDKWNGMMRGSKREMTITKSFSPPAISSPPSPSSSCADVCRPWYVKESLVMGQRWDIKGGNCTINSLLKDLFQKYIRFRMSSPWRKRVLNLVTCRLFALRCSLTALTSWQAVCLDRLDPDTNAVGEMDEKIQE